MARDAVVTLPNVVSLSRLAMAVLFPFVPAPATRFALVVAAGVTDLLDGYLARRSGSVTRLGAKIDPAADRGFMLVAVAVLWYDGTIPAIGALVLVARDVIVLAAWALTRRSGRLAGFGFAARPAGKVLTVLQMAALLTALATPQWLTPLLGAVAAATIVAVVDYTVVLFRARAGRTTAAALAMLLAAAPALSAQGYRVRPAVQGELVAAATTGPGATGLAGIGLNFPAGYYVRVAESVVMGTRADGGRPVRAQIVARFLTDPFRQRRFGPYGGGGLLADWRGGDHGRAAVVLVAGIELPPRAGWQPAAELSFGAGLAAGLSLRRVRRVGR